MKIYGNEKTNLELSEKAQAFYDQTCPIDIKEYETEDGFIYDVTGCVERLNLTEDGVNRFLEACYDEYHAVYNEYGVEINMDVALSLMDDDIYSELDAKLNPCDDQVLFDAYAKAHEEKFGEPWELTKENPVY